LEKRVSVKYAKGNLNLITSEFTLMEVFTIKDVPKMPVRIQLQDRDSMQTLLLD
jgi:hypothetical protein